MNKTFLPARSVPNFFQLRSVSVAAACLCAAAGLAQAQETTSVQQLAPVLVTGNPLANATVLQPGQALSGDTLVLRRGASLGDSLDGLAGVAATGFGPNASRPVLRGLDGDRMRILSNSGASLDASALSYDHAVPLDPLLVERIEVLRGPAALLYGGNAVGGVVNTIDNRIPRQRQSGIGGAAELRLGGAAAERSAAMLVEGGAGALSWHADASTRDSDDLRVPAHLQDGERVTRVRNSAADGRSGALGASLHFDAGYAGVSVDDYHNDYGVTVEPDVGIRMQRQRIATAGEWRWSEGPLRKLQWQLSRSRYAHVEVEGDGAVGTRFSNRGSDARIEAQHAPLGPVQGMFGLQWEQGDFSALGEEALVPSSRTRSQALFLLEQYRSGPLTLAAGLRHESVRVDSAGDAADAEEPRFGSALSRRFSPHSASLQAGYALAAQWNLQFNLSDSRRAPAFYELFADGVHVASGAYERGDVNLGLERARSADLGLVWQGQRSSLRLNVYETRFKGYVALSATGETVDADGESVPVYQFRALPATMRGYEIEYSHQLAQRVLGWNLGLNARLDSVRGVDRSSGEALPRLAPQRATLGAEASDGLWSASAELRLAARQTRVPVLDQPTAGYGVLKLSLARRFKLAGSDALWFLKLDNLGNTLAYQASSIATIRGLAPLAGRSALTGVQLRF